MTDASEPSHSEDTATPEAASLEAIEQDLDTVDEALAALDAGDLDAAEALAAQLDSVGTPTSGRDLRAIDEREPAAPAC